MARLSEEAKQLIRNTAHLPDNENWSALRWDRFCHTLTTHIPRDERARTARVLNRWERIRWAQAQVEYQQRLAIKREFAMANAWRAEAV